MPGQKLARESTTDNSLKDNMRHIRIAALLSAFGMTFGAIFAFLGIGAYAFAASILAWHLPFLAALAFEAAVGGATGFVVGLLALRLRRYYLAIVTLVFGELLRWLYSTPCAASSSRAPALSPWRGRRSAERRRIGFSARAWCRCLRDEIFFPR